MKFVFENYENDETIQENFDSPLGRYIIKSAQNRWGNNINISVVKGQPASENREVFDITDDLDAGYFRYFINENGFINIVVTDN